MAKKPKEKESFSKPRTSIKTKDFILKKPLNGKKIGDKIKLGPKGEIFYKRLNTI